jgi:predicted GTPase
LSRPIEYKDIDVLENEFLFNVLIVGNIGNGKSALTNKLAGREQDVALTA